MQEIEAAVARREERAQLALDVYVHRLAAGIAAMTASTAGLDVLVFTGGVGEHSATVRRLAVERLAYLGCTIDDANNEDGPDDWEITGAGAAVHTLVVAAREDLQMAAESRALLSDQTSR